MEICVQLALPEGMVHERSLHSTEKERPSVLYGSAKDRSTVLQPSSRKTSTSKYTHHEDNARVIR